MVDLSARKYDAHYRRLGLMPGATLEEVEIAARALKLKLKPERLNNGPLKDIAPIRLTEIDESAMQINNYWQRHNAAPASIQNRAGTTAAIPLSFTQSDLPDPSSSASHAPFSVPPAPETVSSALQASPVLLAEGPESPESPTQLVVSVNETEISKSEPRDLIGPSEPELNFSFLLFKKADGAVSPNADVIKSRSIIGLLVLGLLWVAIPLVLVKVLAFFLQDCGVDRWLDYVSILAHVIPICFVPPLVIYEYAFFRQLQFPFAGALRLPVEQAIEDCASRLSVQSTGNSGGWTIEKKSLERIEDLVHKGELVASYTGVEGEKRLPLRIRLRAEELSPDSCFLVYWFELDWTLLFKGRAVSRMKWARFELDRLIKES